VACLGVKIRRRHGTGASMPVLRASSLALFVVGSLEARDGDAHE
jgi:hypothetical protein